MICLRLKLHLITLHYGSRLVLLQGLDYMCIMYCYYIYTASLLFIQYPKYLLIL